jgi:RNA polymerase sigma-70 factor (ECF subfamily)
VTSDGVGAIPDSELVARCRTGDAESWNQLVDRFSRYVYAIATQAFRLPAHDAEDVFQDVFMRAFERLGTLRSDAAVRPWIGQLTRNCCLDRLRAGDRDVVLGDVPERAAEDEIAQLDDAFLVREGLARLSAECREVLERFFCRDESYHTIGDALGIPYGTIASRISRCLGRLRLELEGRNPVPSASSGQVIA